MDKVEEPRLREDDTREVKRQRVERGIAEVLPEFVVHRPAMAATETVEAEIEDEEPADERFEAQGTNGGKKNKSKKKQRGQNKNRDNRQTKEQNVLCPHVMQTGDAARCPFGEQCRYKHDVRAYLAQKKPEVSTAFFARCPVFEALGYCPMGYKCRFLSSHMDAETLQVPAVPQDAQLAVGEVNGISGAQKLQFVKRKYEFPRSEHVLEIIDSMQWAAHADPQELAAEPAAEPAGTADGSVAPQVQQREAEARKLRERRRELYNQYRETRFFHEEKRALDLKGKKIVSPLTTVGNLPFRRLMRTLGADVTYSEMALAVPLIQGNASEWALARAHESETMFGAQIACSKPWQGARACEALAALCPQLSEINLNAGCPLDLLYRQGSGSALLDNPARMIRVLQAMDYSANEVPVTLKMRTGVRDGDYAARTLIPRVVQETGVQAITLHGRSRLQRYTREADWEAIAQAGRVLRESEAQSEDDRDRRERSGRIQFVGNGDVYSYKDWYRHLEQAPEMDSVMVARGALIKPWIFEEVAAQQHLDKSASERMDMLREYARFAMEHWGTDEYGIARSRRFFCEFMSFFHRYVPLGILARGEPQALNERARHWRGRDDVETLLGSAQASDWVKLSETFFGPVEDAFVFVPKHKSSSST